MISFKRWSMFIGCLIAIIFNSCSKPRSEEKKDLQILRINIHRDPPTLDPRKGGDVISSALHFLLFEGLTRLNSDSSTSLAQAERVDLSEDKKTYTFHLRNSRWSDGSPVTADDFEQAWKNILTPSFPAFNAHLFFPIKNAEAAKKGLLPLNDVGIRAVNPRTLIVELEKPTPYFLQLTAFCAFFPIKQQIDRINPQWAYETSEYFVSNGPYILKKWKHNDQIILEKNVKYWEAETTGPDFIHVSMVDNEVTALHMFENGELDILGAPLSPIPIDSLDTLSKKGMLKTQPIAGTTICVFNNQSFPFQNIHIRKAFAYAINRSSIVSHITQLNEKVALEIVPPVLKNYRSKIFFQDDSTELAREHLRKGLTELGIEKDALSEMTYCYAATEINHKVAQTLQQQWLDVLGLEVKLETTEHKILLDRLSQRQFTFAQTFCLAQYSDPMNILERYKLRSNAKNYAGWENDEYAHLLELSTDATTSQERFVLLEKAEQLLLDEMPLTPLFHWNFAYIAQPYIKNLASSPMGGIYFSKIKIDNKEGGPL